MEISSKQRLHFEDLDQRGHTIVEYVWIGGNGDDLRSKCKTIKGDITRVEQLSEWNYDGSSTCQATTENSEVLMRPVALFNDPFRKNGNKIALCDTYHIDGTPTNTNFRAFAKKIFDKGVEEHDPWFGIEQEYVVMNLIGTGLSWPVGWPEGNFPQCQGQYYCSTGSGNNFARELMNAHYKACLYAGVAIYGTNAEVMPGQWEFQVGNSKGIDIGDHLWMARYILERVAEYFYVRITFEAKPIKGDIKAIHEQLNNMSREHVTSISLYGLNNHLRLTGIHETSSMDQFSYGVGNRAASVRIPRTTENAQCGYYEDRRPAGDIDPYVVGASLFSITCLDNFGLEELRTHYTNFTKELALRK
jgi:glutamine synthetase